MTAKATLDHRIIHVSDWKGATAFYLDVLGAEPITVGKGIACRFGYVQINRHGPDQIGAPRAKLPVMPGGSDLCFERHGPVEEAIAHLRERGVAIECGPTEHFGAKGAGTSVYFRDPDGSLMEFISYRGT